MPLAENITTPTDYEPSVMSTVVSQTRILQTTNDCIPFISALNLIDEELKEIMDDYNNIVSAGAEETVRQRKSQQNLQSRTDELFLLETAPESDDKTKKMKSLKNSISHYKRKLKHHDEKLELINLQLNKFDIIGKRASNTYQMIKLFNAYKIPFVDEISNMMVSLSVDETTNTNTIIKNHNNDGKDGFDNTIKAQPNDGYNKSRR